jgi:hypothetical protein
MRSPATLRWIGLALLGIAIAAAVAVAASRLAGQEIGLASEPISAGDALAPTSVRTQPERAPELRPTPSPRASPPPRSTGPAPLPTPTDDSRQGSGDEGGSDGDADD